MSKARAYECLKLRSPHFILDAWCSEPLEDFVSVMCQGRGEKGSDNSKARDIIAVLLSLFPPLNSTGRCIQMKSQHHTFGGEESWGVAACGGVGVWRRRQVTAMRGFGRGVMGQSEAAHLPGTPGVLSRALRC